MIRWHSRQLTSAFGPSTNGSLSWRCLQGGLVNIEGYLFDCIIVSFLPQYSASLSLKYLLHSFLLRSVQFKLLNWSLICITLRCWLASFDQWMFLLRFLRPVLVPSFNQNITPSSSFFHFLLYLKKKIFLLYESISNSYLLIISGTFWWIDWTINKNAPAHEGCFWGHFQD